MVCAPAVPRLTASELDGVPVAQRATADRDGHGESNVAVDKRYLGIEYRANVVVTTGSFAQDVAQKRPLPSRGYY